MDGRPIDHWSIKQIVDLLLATGGKRLLLPPIQRSVVWSNEQVINYWDSLLRGYPAGMLFIHRPNHRPGEDIQGQDSNGKTVDASTDDLMLFDGQQRLAAVLLGRGEGRMVRTRKLWVDIGSTPSKSSGLRYQLRISSLGQPFGYKPDAPNQKAELSKRLCKWQKWSTKSPDEAFAMITGEDLIEGTCAIPFATIWKHVLCYGVTETIKTFSAFSRADGTIVESFVKALSKTADVQVPFQHVPSGVVDNLEEYIRFFGRVGQGGTRLSEDELSYSIIKSQYPKIHDRMTDLTRGGAGRLADEVDLVLAALRVAKTLAPWTTAKEWEIISRPTPSFVSGLKGKIEVARKFLEFIPPEKSSPAKLEIALVGVRTALTYHGHAHPEGFPSILLGWLPRELIDVLVLLAERRGMATPWEEADRATLRSFVLHWLLFVGNDGKSAWLAFQHCQNRRWEFQKESIRALIGEYERAGAARFLPRQNQLRSLREQVKQGDHILRPWANRFTAADAGNERKPGEAIRVLSTHPKLIRRALAWLQRHYIARKFPSYDPTSERDDDLPVDLDHIIPVNVFGFRWNDCENRLEKEVISDNFRWRRTEVGNSLGNFRWLAASENRSRRDGAYEPLPGNGDLVSNPDGWRDLGCSERWSKKDVCSFQRLIDLRTIDLYERILTESGMSEILPEAESEGDVVAAP